MTRPRLPSHLVVLLCAALAAGCNAQPPTPGGTDGGTDGGSAAPPGTCHDGVQDGHETAVDCGGGCDGCPAGDACGAGTDCHSGVCEDGTCQAPSCSDGVRNGDETAVDCGGSCGPCVPASVPGAVSVAFPYGLAIHLTGVSPSGDDFGLMISGCSASDGRYFPPAPTQGAHLTADGHLDLSGVTDLAQVFDPTPLSCDAGGVSLATSFTATGQRGWYVLYEAPTTVKGQTGFQVTLQYQFVGSDGTVYAAHAKAITIDVPQYAPLVQVATATGATQQVAGDVIGGLGLMTEGQLVPGQPLPGLAPNVSLDPSSFGGVYLLARTGAGHPAGGDPGFLTSYLGAWDNVATEVTVSLRLAVSGNGGTAPVGTFAVSSDYALGGQVQVATDGQSVTFAAPADGADVTDLVSSIYWVPRFPAPAFQAGDRFEFRYAVQETGSTTRSCPVPVYTAYDPTTPGACVRQSQVSFWAQVTTDPSQAGLPLGP